MKILLFGGGGQLGFEIRKRAHDLNFEVVSPVSSEVDVGNFEQVKFLSDQVKPSLIINSAAYTAVDKAETDKDAAFRINRDGAANVARAAADLSCRVIYVSTDYVYDGTAKRPIPETTPTAPLNVYGASKLAGENAVIDALGDRALIVRTSSLHGQKGVNFVETMIRLFEERDLVKVVSDQWMSPTWAGWLAEVLLDLGRSECSGVVHAASAGEITWFDFATAILELSKPKLKKTTVQLGKITAAEFGRPAKRPRYSVLDCSRLASLLGRPNITWEDGLRHHLSEIGYL